MGKSIMFIANLLLIHFACASATVSTGEQYQFQLETLSIEIKNNSDGGINETRTENETIAENYLNVESNKNEDVVETELKTENKTGENFDENGVPIVIFTLVDTKNESKTNDTTEHEMVENASKNDTISSNSTEIDIFDTNLDTQNGFENTTNLNDSQGNETVVEISEIHEESRNNTSVGTINTNENDEQKNVTADTDENLNINKTDFESNVESKLNLTTDEENKDSKILEPQTTSDDKMKDEEKMTLENSTLIASEVLNKSDNNGEFDNLKLENIILKHVTNSTAEVQKSIGKNEVETLGPDNVQNRTGARNLNLKIESRTLSAESDYIDVGHSSDKDLNETEILSIYGNIMRIEKFERLFEDFTDRNESVGELGVNVPEVQDVAGMQHGPRQKRKTKSSKEKLWPKGIVYYQISDSFSDAEANTIILAMKHVALRTKCIKFHPYTGKQKDWVKFKLGHNGCRANTGRQGGRQYIMLEIPVCVSSDPKTAHNVAHEIGHILGLHHEHTRGDRDKYIEILWENIEKGEEINFRKEKDYLPDVPYSYNSIMHYSQYAFSPAGLKSMVPKVETKYVGSLGVYDKYDVEKIRKMYQCVGYDSLLE